MSTNHAGLLDFSDLTSSTIVGTGSTLIPPSPAGALPAPYRLKCMFCCSVRVIVIEPTFTACLDILDHNRFFLRGIRAHAPKCTCRREFLNGPTHTVRLSIYHSCLAERERDPLVGSASFELCDQIAPFSKGRAFLKCEDLGWVYESVGKIRGANRSWRALVPGAPLPGKSHAHFFIQATVAGGGVDLKW